MRKAAYLVPALLLVLSASVVAEDTIRVCSWNLLEYSVTNADGRATLYKTVIQDIDPDILIVQDVVDGGSVNQLRSMLGIAWRTRTFNDGPGTDNHVYWKSGVVELGLRHHHSTAARDIAEYEFTLPNSGDTLRVFSVHLSTGATVEAAAARAAETQVLRNRLLELTGSNEPAYFIVAGGFNMQSGTEEGYTALTQSSLLIDPIGNWQRDSEASAMTYTFSTRSATDTSCGGGTGNGLRDRFDMILHSDDLREHALDGYRVFGNDDRWGDPVNNPANSTVSAEIADALRCASDHLPVVADFAFSTVTAVGDAPAHTAALRIYPMPVTEHSVVDLSAAAGTTTLSIVDMVGRELAVIAVNGRTRVPLPALAPGVYLCRAGAQSALFVVR